MPVKSNIADISLVVSITHPCASPTISSQTSKWSRMSERDWDVFWDSDGLVSVDCWQTSRTWPNSPQGLPMGQIPTLYILSMPIGHPILLHNMQCLYTCYCQKSQILLQMCCFYHLSWQATGILEIRWIFGTFHLDLKNSSPWGEQQLPDCNIPNRKICVGI